MAPGEPHRDRLLGSEGGCNHCGLQEDYFDESDYGVWGFPAFNGANPYRPGRSYSCMCCCAYCQHLHEEERYRWEIYNEFMNSHTATLHTANPLTLHD